MRCLEMELTLLVDFGSTYTKLTAVDLEREEVVATAPRPDDGRY